LAVHKNVTASANSELHPAPLAEDNDMLNPRPALAAALVLATLAAPSHATTVNLAADGQWNVFNVNDLDAQSFGVEWIDNNDSLSPDFGTPLDFAFTIASGFIGTLRVVDAGFAGDTFQVTNFGALLGSTSAVPLQDVATAPDLGWDFDAALADAAFSHGEFTLGAGSYRINGLLGQSVTSFGQPLNATVGALSLNIAPAVPEPSTWAFCLGGLGLMAFVARRRS
jgi:hypothetical protein